MNRSENLNKLAVSVFEAMNSREFGPFENIITEDVSFDFPGVGRTEGSRRTLLLLKSLLRKYPKLRFTISEVITGENRACVVWTNQGEDIRGNPYSNSGITLLHFSQGKIRYISDYFKDTSFVERSTS